MQRNGRVEDAIKKWQSIANIAQGIDDALAARSWYSIGYLQAEAGRETEALSAYNQALALKPDYAEVYYNRGNVKLAQDQRKAALEDYNQAIRLKPNFAEAYYDRGFVQVNLRNIKAAQADFQIVLKLAGRQNKKNLKADREKMRH